MTPPVEPEFDPAHHAGWGVIVGYPHGAQPTQHQVVVAINTFVVAHVLVLSRHEATLNCCRVYLDTLIEMA